MTNPSFPSGWQAVGLLVLLGLAHVLLALLALLLGLPEESPAVFGAITLAGGVAVAWFAWRKRGGPLAATFPLRRVSGAILAATILTVCGLGILVSEMDNALRTVLPPPSWLAEFFETIADTTQGAAGPVFAVVVAAPLTEELLFRGVFLHGFLARYSTRAAVVGSALLFGLAHLNPWQFAGAVLFGVVAAWWVIGTGSLVPGLLGHALNNGLPWILTASGLTVPGYTTGLGPVPQFQPLWFDALGAALLAGGLWLARREFRAGFSVAASQPPM